jgi:hypothetical protein
MFDGVPCQKFMVAHIFDSFEYLRLFINIGIVRINIRMEKVRPWPTNIYGNQWRSSALCFDWPDKETVFDAIQEIDPLKITVRSSRAVAAIAFRNVTEAVMGRLITSWSHTRWDADKLYAIVDPCHDPDAMIAEVEQWWWPVKFSLFGVTMVHFSDEHTFRRLKVALKDRRHLLTGRIPVIEF